MSPMWVDFIDICQFQIYQDFRMGLAGGIGALLLGGRLELIGIGSFLMVEYHKSSAAYANQLKLCIRKTSGVAPIRRKMSLTPRSW